MQDLPRAVLLHGLIPLLDPPEQHALFRSSRQLSQLVLERRIVTLSFQLRVGTFPATSAGRSVAMACRHASEVHLKLLGFSSEDKQELRDLMQEAVEDFGGPLLPVTDLAWEVGSRKFSATKSPRPNRTCACQSVPFSALPDVQGQE